MRTQIAAGMLVFAVGCGVDSRPPVEPLARLDLHAAFGNDNIVPIGLAIAPDGTRFVFDEVLGLYRLDGDFAARVVAMDAMPDPGPTAPLRRPFTDMVALSSTQFAITAIGDGYILDTEAMTLTQRFCYLPGDDGTGTPLAIQQRTDALTYDAVANELYAQPVTRDLAGTFVRSELAIYNGTTGQDTTWYQVRDTIAATGMIILDGTIVLGQDSVLLRQDGAAQLKLADDLERFGVRSIDGMSLDPISGALVIVDKDTGMLVDIDRATLDF